MRSILLWLFTICLTICGVGCESLFDNIDEDEQNIPTIYELDSTLLKGWDFGYTYNDEYFVGHFNEDNSITTMVNKIHGKLEDAFIVHINKNHIPIAVGINNCMYNVKYSDDEIITYRFEAEDYTKESTAYLSDTFIFNNHKISRSGIGVGIDLAKITFETFDAVHTSNSIFTSLNNWDFYSALKDASTTSIIAGITIINPVVGSTISVGMLAYDVVVGHYTKQFHESQREALYQQCEIEINDIRNENGECTIYATVYNANTILDYLVNFYEQTLNENTKNNVYCGIVARTQNGYVTTHMNDYQSQIILINEDNKWSDKVHLAFIIPEIDLGKNHDIIYFRPYLKSTRIHDSSGDVNEGYIRYGNTVPYQCFTGEIKEFKQLAAECITNNKNKEIHFYTTVHASIESLEEIDEWGVYVYNINNDGTYDHYPSEFKCAKLEDYINIDFFISKEMLDYMDPDTYFASKNITIGIYKKIKNPLNLYEYLNYIHGEKETYELVYHEEPSFIFSNAYIGNIVILNESKGEYVYESDFNFEFNIKGAFWFDRIYLDISPDMQMRLGNIIEYHPCDGFYTDSFRTKYESDILNQFYVSIAGDYSTEGKYLSNSCIKFSGTPINQAQIINFDSELEVE